MESSGPALRLSNRCAAPASIGKVGICRFAVCVDVIVEPFGTCTRTAVKGVVFCLFRHGVLLGKYIPEHPVSAMAKVGMGLQLVEVVEQLRFSLFVSTLLPIRQLIHLVDPPCLLSSVAESTCPSAFRLQVLLV